MIVKQYAAKFIELGRFEPHLIFRETMRVKQFQDGLQAQIRTQVAYLKMIDFQKLRLVHKASIVE